jgi:arylsulfatase A-like enzyme
VYLPGEGKATRVKAYWGSVLALKPKGIRRWRAWLDPQQAWERPNVILISLDTLGARHLSQFGAPAGVSPRIDAWLDRSFSFRRAYAQYPNTLGSHASLFTGLYPVQHGVYDVFTKKVPKQTLAAALARAGYVTLAFTEDAFVSSDFGFDNGFDWYDNGESKIPTSLPGRAEQTFAKATQVLKGLLRETRFFLFVHTYEVHSPYVPKDAEALAFVNEIDPGYQGRFAEGYDDGAVEINHNAGIAVVSERECKRLEALYRGEIHYLDRVLHGLLNEQQALPNARNTLVIVTADHGDEFCEHGKLGHGETLYNPVLHVPLAFYWPGRVERGTYDDPVELVDVKPTVLELAGLPVPTGLHGVSLAPLLLRKQKMLVRQPAFAEMRVVPFAAGRAKRGVCTQMGLPADCRVERVAVQDRRFKLISSLYPPFELLFDLETDPGETRDVAAEFPAEAERLRQWVRKYRDGWQTADGSPEKTSPAVDPATLERLRGLGYVE